MLGRNKQIKDVIEDGHKRKRNNMEGAKTVSNAGIQRFSELVAVVESKRSNEESKLLEEEIIKRSIEMSSMAILSLEIQNLGMK